MTCASCAARIERKLNKLDGVTASVNYATEKARVDLGATGLSVDDVIAADRSDQPATVARCPSATWARR